MYLHANVPDTAQLRWWTLRLGNNVDVVAPEHLCREIAETLRAACADYVP